MTRSVTARREVRGHLKSQHSFESSVPASCMSWPFCFCLSAHVKDRGRCSGDRGPTFASVPPAQVSAECPLSSAVQRRGGGAGSSLAGETHSTSFTSTGIQTGRQCRQAMQAGRQAATRLLLSTRSSSASVVSVYGLQNKSKLKPFVLLCFSKLRHPVLQ